MSQFDRSELVSLAECYFQNGAYNDVIGYMKKVIEMVTPLNFHEKGLVFDSYNSLKKPYINTYYPFNRCSLNEKLSREVRKKSDTAINRICDEAIELLNSYLVERDVSNEAVAHCKGYIARQYYEKAFIISAEESENTKSRSLEYFEEASKIANENLNPAHPVRLSIACDFSKFHYKILDSVSNGLAISKDAYQKGKHCLVELPEDLKYHAEKHLKELSENIDNWS